MLYAIMNDFRECEIYIQNFDENEKEKFIETHSEIGPAKVSQITDTFEKARIAAHKESEQSMWLYNPARNKCT